MTVPALFWRGNGAEPGTQQINFLTVSRIHKGFKTLFLHDKGRVRQPERGLNSP